MMKTAMRAMSTAARRANFGVVFDVDGVLLRGKTPIPGASKVLQQLRDDRIPFAVMTNGGGYPEEIKAEQLSSLLDVKIPSSNVCMSHTPMQALAEKHRDELVLAVGKDSNHVHQIMADYGFRNVVTSEEMHEYFPTLYPDLPPPNGPKPHNDRLKDQRFGAVFVLIDPLYWGRDLQIVIDTITAENGAFGTVSDKQQIPLYSACADFHYVGEFHLPRFGAGAFRTAVEDLYKRTTGHELDQTKFGKPEETSFQYIENLLVGQSPDIEKLYMIGDNPLTDVQGANRMGGRWRSILTLTGMHPGPENDDDHPAYKVVQDVSEALEFMKKDSQS